MALFTGQEVVNLINFGGKYKPMDSEVGGGGSLYSAGGLVTLEYSVWGGGGGLYSRGSGQVHEPQPPKLKPHP